MLSSTGRIGRLPFLPGMGLLLALGLAYRRGVHGELHRWTAFIVYCCLLFSAACLLSKRLHDRGRAGWWAFLPVFAIIGLWPMTQDFLNGFCGAVIVITFVDLGLMPGKAGPNRFGFNPAQPDPRLPAPLIPAEAGTQILAGALPSEQKKPGSPPSRG